MTLERGEVRVEPGALFVDCTASAVEPRPLQPIFQDGRIVLQLVRVPQPTFSAAIIAYVEVHGGDDARKNRLCAPAPVPASPRRLRALDARQHDERRAVAAGRGDATLGPRQPARRVQQADRLGGPRRRRQAGADRAVSRAGGKAFANLGRLAAASP
jgi:hypothetical protein